MEIKSVAFYQRLSKAALAMPDLYEKSCFRTPAFYVEKKFFVRLKEDGKTIALYNNERDEWIAQNDDVFFTTDHYKNYPMLLVNLEMVSNADLKTLIQTAWELRAPKKLLKQFRDRTKMPFDYKLLKF